MDDPQRLAAVESLELEDAEQLAVLGRVNDLAVQLLGVPISVVSMVTAGRHVSLSQAGLSDDRRSHMELPLTHTLCQHVVTSGEALVIDDASTHPLSKATKGVSELGIGAYAGAPLVAGGQTIGAVCAIDTRPRGWSAEQLSALTALRDIAAELLDQRRMLLEARLRDPVTALPRGKLFESQVTVLQQSLAPGEGLNVTTITITEFAKINDQFGHQIGDDILNEVADRLTATVVHPRRPGAVTRIAGATFITASIVSLTEPEGRRARDLTDAATGAPVHHGRTRLHAATTSFRTTGEPTPSELLRRATDEFRPPAQDVAKSAGQ